MSWDPRMTWVEKRLRWLGRRLDPWELQASDDVEATLSEAEVLRELEGESASDRFLDYYTRTGIERALRAYGLWSALEERGFRPVVTLYRVDRLRHLFRVTDGPEGPVLVELEAHRDRFRPRRAVCGLGRRDRLELLAIDWLLMQDPRAAFPPDRIPLPGQRHPGLGLGREVMVLIEIMAERVGCSGVLAYPEHYHNAALYDRRFRFFWPEKEGELRALERTLAPLDLAVASWAVELGYVYRLDRLGRRRRWHWRGEEMIRPLDARLKAFFTSACWRRRVEAAENRFRFGYDPESVAALAERLRREGPPPTDGDREGG